MNTLENSMTKTLTGAERACVMMITMGESRSKNILSQLESNEVEIISKAMKNLGKVSSSVVEKVINLFNENISNINKDNTKKKDAKKRETTLWNKLDYVNEEILARYIQNEHPQTAAIIIQKINSERAGKIIELLPDKLASEIINRIAKTEPIKNNILSSIEDSLSRDILSSLDKTKYQSKNINNVMEILKNTSHKKSVSILSQMKSNNPKVSKDIDNLIFKFDDIIYQEANTIKKIVEICDQLTIAKALKGSSLEVANVFYKNIDNSIAESIKERIAQMGPIKIRELDTAQTEISLLVHKLDENNLLSATEKFFKSDDPDYPALYRNQENVKFVLDAMFRSTNEVYGTSFSSRIEDPKYQFAGKTGTAQVKRITDEERELDLKTNQIPYRERDHAWYVAFGPYKDPRYAVSILVEHGGSGSATAAPIAKELFKFVIDRHELREEIKIKV